VKSGRKKKKNQKRGDTSKGQLKLPPIWGKGECRGKGRGGGAGVMVLERRRIHAMGDRPRGPALASTKKSEKVNNGAAVQGP